MLGILALMLGILARILGISARRVECQDKQDLAEARTPGISARILGILVLMLGILARIPLQKTTHLHPVPQ